ncbi:hypothetical protein LTR17_011490 [Elasticomyces elasticus]|nr:hypothetical protein LTR17_011490 [Elasticomyces elasticus]
MPKQRTAANATPTNSFTMSKRDTSVIVPKQRTAANATSTGTSTLQTRDISVVVERTFYT